MKKIVSISVFILLSIIITSTDSEARRWVHEKNELLVLGDETDKVMCRKAYNPKAQYRLQPGGLLHELVDVRVTVYDTSCTPVAQYDPPVWESVMILFDGRWYSPLH